MLTSVRSSSPHRNLLLLQVHGLLGQAAAQSTVAGIVGVKKFAYDIWGDTVNTASRMESSGEVGEVNISEATYERVKDLPGLTFTVRGKVQAKGKGEMEMYFAGRNAEETELDRSELN